MPPNEIHYITVHFKKQDLFEIFSIFFCLFEKIRLLRFLYGKIFKKASLFVLHSLKKYGIIDMIFKNARR